MPAASNARWLSYRVGLRRELEEFLAESAIDILSSIRRRDLADRFFFVSLYDEEDEELKVYLRFRQSARQTAGSDTVQRVIQEEVVDEEVVEPDPYSRIEHYFGDRPASVYAELMNEQSSLIAIKLASAYGTERRVRFILLAFVLDFVITNATPGREEALRQIHRSAEFAAHVLRTQYPGTSFSAWEPEKVTTLMHRNRDAIADIFEDENLKQFTALVRRTYREISDGARIVTHALHLLCNKCGYFINQEHQAFRVLHHYRTQATAATVSEDAAPHHAPIRALHRT